MPEIHLTRVTLTRVTLTRVTRALLLAAAPIVALPLGAQEAPARADSAVRGTVTLAGVVRDTAGRPLAGAEVRSGATSFVLTEEDGTFVLRGLEPDTVQLLVRRIGYQPADVLLAAQAGLRVEVAVTLVPVAVELGTIVVEGRRMDTRLWQSGFYDRQKSGQGRFFGPEVLERFGGSGVGTLMHEVPSVRVSRGPFGSAVAYGPSATGGYCPLNVFLDGVYVRWAADVGLDQLVARQDVLAVEVYPRATQVPATLAGHSGATAMAGGVPSPPTQSGSQARGVGSVDCGAIVIWTRPFDPAKQEAR